MRGPGDDPVQALGVVPVGGVPRVVACHTWGPVSVRDLNTGRPVAERSVPEMNPVRCAVVGELSGRPVVVAGGPSRLVRVHLDTDEHEVLPLDSEPTAVAVGGQVMAVGTRTGALWIWRQGEPARAVLFTREVSSVAVVRTHRGEVVVATGLYAGSWVVAAVDARTGDSLWREVPWWFPASDDGDWHWALDVRPSITPDALEGERLTVVAWHDEDMPAVVLCRRYTRTLSQVGILRMSGLPTWRLGMKPYWGRSRAAESGMRLTGFAGAETGPLALWVRGSVVAVADFPLLMRDPPEHGIVRLAKRLYPSNGLLIVVAMAMVLWASTAAVVIVLVAMFLLPVAAIFLRPEEHRPGVEPRPETRWQAIELDAEVTSVAFAAPSTVVAATPQGLITVELNDLDKTRSTD